MRRIVCLVMLSISLLGFSPPANAAGFRGAGSVHEMHGGGFRGGFEGRGHFGGHGHFRGGVFVGPVFWDPWWVYPYPYSVTPVVIDQQPVEYISPDSLSGGSNYWYFCKASEAYYPNVARCDDGWIKVAPAPPQ